MQNKQIKMLIKINVAEKQTSFESIPSTAP